MNVKQTSEKSNVKILSLIIFFILYALYLCAHLLQQLQQQN